MRKFKYTIFFLILLFPLFIPSEAYAVTLVNPIKWDNLGELITQASSLITPLSILGFIVSVIYAGWVRMTAAGNPEKEQKSMKIAISAAVGFAIIALALPLVTVLARIFGLQGF